MSSSDLDVQGVDSEKAAIFYKQVHEYYKYKEEKADKDRSAL